MEPLQTVCNYYVTAYMPVLLLRPTEMLIYFLIYLFYSFDSTNFTVNFHSMLRNVLTKSLTYFAFLPILFLSLYKVELLFRCGKYRAIIMQICA